jgi:hypothetical protein
MPFGNEIYMYLMYDFGVFESKIILADKLAPSKSKSLIFDVIIFGKCKIPVPFVQCALLFPFTNGLWFEATAEHE